MRLSHQESRAHGTYWQVGDEVMNVVAALPPSNGQATAEVGDEDTNGRVDDKVASDGAMSSIVGAEHDLMLSREHRLVQGEIARSV